MATILPQNPPSFGESLGRGLGSGIQQLAEMQMQNFMRQKQQQQTSRFYETLGLPGDLVHAPEKVQQAYLQGASALGGLGGQQQNYDQNVQINRAEPIEDLLASLYGNNALPNMSPQMAQAMQSQVPQLPQPPAPRKRKPTGQEILAEGFKTPAERTAEKKMAQQERHFQAKQLAKEKEDAFKESKKIREELLSKKKASKNTIEDIERFEELEKEGLPSAGYMEFLKNSNLDIPALVGATGEEYNKIAANFVRNAKTMFGNKLTDADLMQFLKTVPSLANSPEGRKRINANLKRIANLDIAAVDTYNDIVKENKGIPPRDLDIQLDAALDKKREAIARQFKEDLKKEVPKGQNEYVTALLSGAGKLVGRVPKALGGAAVGAAAGSVFPGLGTTAGAGLGALAGLTGYSVKDILP